MIAQAEGDAQRFTRVLTEYQKAPGVTRDRLYIDTMQQIYANVSKVMIDSRNNSNLLYLPLDKLMQSRRRDDRRAGAGRDAGAGRQRRRQRRFTFARQPARPRSRRPLRRTRENTRMNRIGLIVGGVLLLLMLAASTLFVVDQRQMAVVYALGEIKEVIVEPGLKFKLPPPFQNVVFLDRRIQTLDSPDTRPIFTAEKKSLVIDWLVKWRVAEPRQFIRNNGMDIRNLEARLAPVVHAAFNEEVTKRTVGRRAVHRARQGHAGRARAPGRRRQVLRHRDPRRAHQARRLRRQHHRLDLQPHALRAQAGRQRAALDRRGRRARRSAPTPTGSARSSSPRPTAMRRRSRARATPRASATFAEAFGKDPQFAQFYRSLEAYRASFRNQVRRDGGRSEQRVLPRDARHLARTVAAPATGPRK